jgi:ABC-type xylose transport system permease subunit
VTGVLPSSATPEATERRAAKFRQAAFVYLHVAILYEAAALAMMRRGMLPTHRGPPWMWLVAGAVVAALVFVGLYRWQNAWFARAVWAIHGLRIPALVSGAFFADPAPRMSPAFYLTALIVVMINLWMLARAGWDL